MVEASHIEPTTHSQPFLQSLNGILDVNHFKQILQPISDPSDVKPLSLFQLLACSRQHSLILTLLPGKFLPIGCLWAMKNKKEMSTSLRSRDVRVSQRYLGRCKKEGEEKKSNHATIAIRTTTCVRQSRLTMWNFSNCMI